MDRHEIGLILLTLALVSLWFDRERDTTIRLSMVLAFSAIAHAIGFQYIEPIALPFVALWFGLLYWFRSRPASGSTLALIVTLAAAFFLHAVPGFHRLPSFDAVVLSPGALPYSQNFNIDKALVGFGLLTFCVPLAPMSALPRLSLMALAWGTGLGLMISAVAVAIGYIDFDPKWISDTGRWAWCNLFFTCIPEEALMRGVIQYALQNRLRDYHAGQQKALVAASIIFGLSHVAGGHVYVLLSTLAGLGYGWIVLRTNAIETSILTHFTLNLLHFVFFTYPALAPVVPVMAH